MKGAWGDGVSIGQDWRHGGESRSDPAGLLQAAVRGWALKGQRGAGGGARLRAPPATLDHPSTNFTRKPSVSSRGSTDSLGSPGELLHGRQPLLLAPKWFLWRTEIGLSIPPSL